MGQVMQFLTEETKKEEEGRVLPKTDEALIAEKSRKAFDKEFEEAGKEIEKKDQRQAAAEQVQKAIDDEVIETEKKAKEETKKLAEKKAPKKPVKPIPRSRKDSSC